MANPNSAVFPGRIALDSDLMVSTNASVSTLALPIDNVQTSFSVADGSKFVAPCLVQIDTEVIYVGSVLNNILQNCNRGFSQTTPAPHAQNVGVKGYFFAYHHNQMAAEIKAIETTLYNLNPNPPIYYQAAIQQGASPVLNPLFSHSTTVPTAVAATTTHGSVFAVASFAHGVSAAILQNSFAILPTWLGFASPLPTPPKGTITLDVYWRSTAGTGGTIVWQCLCGWGSPTLTTDISFNAAATTSTSYTTGMSGLLQHNIITLALGTIPTIPVTVPITPPGMLLFFQFSRGTDSLAGTAELVSLQFNVN